MTTSNFRAGLKTTAMVLGVFALILLAGMSVPLSFLFAAKTVGNVCRKDAERVAGRSLPDDSDQWSPEARERVLKCMGLTP